MNILEGTRLTFDDVLLVPQYSEINSRETIDLSQDFLHINLTIPILSANMDLVTGARMVIAMRNAGGLGILHRFYSSWEQERKDIDEILVTEIPIVISIGIRDFDEAFKKIEYIAGFRKLEGFDNAIFTVCIDVAHGYHKQVRDLIIIIKKSYPQVKIIAGNVSTWDGYYFLAQSGADAVKVGIGPGSTCTTRIVTGFGYPQLSAIIDIASERNKRIDRYGELFYDSFKFPIIIADGGIKSSGDIVKSLAAGADVVMLGNLLAGTEETPGEVLESVTGRKFRRYRGQSIFGVNGERYVKEGISGFVEEKGPVANVLKYLVGGIRSGLSYAGATNLKELRENAEFIQVSAHTVHESNPRLAEVM